jgi:hypothetical protein
MVFSEAIGSGNVDIIEMLVLPCYACSPVRPGRKLLVSLMIMATVLRSRTEPKCCVDSTTFWKRFVDDWNVRRGLHT